MAEYPQGQPQFVEAAQFEEAGEVAGKAPVDDVEWENLIPIPDIFVLYTTLL